MKKILLSSFVLLFFAASITIFQISCSKQVEAHEDNSSSNSNILLYLNTSFNTSETELWAMNANGSNDHKINIILPAGYLLQNYSSARFLTGQNKIIFSAQTFETETGYEIWSFFKCNLNGSGLQKIKDGPVNSLLNIQDLSESGYDD